MIIKQLVSCPTCEKVGRRNILGEVKNGCLEILKSHDPLYGVVKITGEFQVFCGVCDEPVYFKTIGKEVTNGTNVSYRREWVYRVGTMPTVGEPGTASI